MKQLQEDRPITEDTDTLEAVIYDIFLYGKSDPMMMNNLKMEYDNMIGRKLILRAIDRLDIIIDYNKIFDQLLKYKIKVV